MKVLLVNYEFKPQCGGAGYATYNLAKELVRHSLNVDLLIGWDYSFGFPPDIPNVGYNVISLKKKSIHESSIIGVAKFVIEGLIRIHKLTRKNRYDVIMFFFSVPTGILKYGIYGNTPYICSLRGIDVPSSRKDKYRAVRNCLEYINSKIVRKADTVTALSSELSDWFNKVYPEIKVDVIPNGIDVRQYRKKNEYRKNVYRFVTVSRLIDCKNIELSMYAFKTVHEKYPEIELDIYGEGYLHDHLQGVIDKENMGDYVSLQGYKSQEEIIGLLSDYDVFYLLTVADSFGQVFIEAMACGLPVICADIGGPKDIVVDHKTGIMAKANDKESAEKAIMYYIEHPEIARDHGINGHERICNYFTIEYIAEMHIRLFEETVRKYSEEYLCNN